MCQNHVLVLVSVSSFNNDSTILKRMVFVCLTFIFFWSQAVFPWSFVITIQPAPGLCPHMWSAIVLGNKQIVPYIIVHLQQRLQLWAAFFLCLRPPLCCSTATRKLYVTYWQSWVVWFTTRCRTTTLSPQSTGFSSLVVEGSPPRHSIVLQWQNKTSFRVVVLHKLKEPLTLLDTTASKNTRAYVRYNPVNWARQNQHSFLCQLKRAKWDLCS